MSPQHVHYLLCVYQDDGPISRPLIQQLTQSQDTNENFFQ